MWLCIYQKGAPTDFQLRKRTNAVFNDSQRPKRLARKTKTQPQHETYAALTVRKTIEEHLTLGALGVGSEVWRVRRVYAINLPLPSPPSSFRVRDIEILPPRVDEVCIWSGRIGVGFGFGFGCGLAKLLCFINACVLQ